jgi:hypothetical protein
MKRFQATGVWPMEADAVLKRFNNHPPEQDKDLEIGQNSEGDGWNQLRKVLDAAVADKAKDEAKRLSQSIHSLQVNNELLHHGNLGLQQALNAKKKHKKKSMTLDLQNKDTWHSGAQFYSPRKVEEGRRREATKQDEAQRKRLQKTHNGELKVAATLYKKKQAEAAEEARQKEREEAAMAQKARAEKLAAARELKKQRRDAATAQKSHNTPNKSKRKASHKAAKIPAKRRRVVGGRSGVAPAPAPAPAPPKATRTRNVKPPQRYSE